MPIILKGRNLKKMRIEMLNKILKPKNRLMPAILVAAILLTSAAALMLSLSACGPPSLSFETVIISPAIDPTTSEPLDPSEKYGMDTRQIFATIKYKGVMGKDTWRFKWIYKETGETVLDNGDKYKSDEPEGYFQGIVNSNIYITEGDKIIPPGNYTVEFYHNGKFQSSAGFTISKPQMELIDLTLANKIDDRGAPFASIAEFKTNETVYACISANYVILGNTLKALWKDSKDNIINEESIDIQQDYYEKSWVWFSLELANAAGASPIEPGTYSVEILLNNVIFSEAKFKVLKSDPVSFDQGITYKNDKYGFTISIPDDWSYEERPSENAIMIEMSPEKYDITRFAFIASLSAPLAPYDKFAEEDAAGFANENGWTQLNSQSRDYNLASGDAVKEIMYLHQDAQGGKYITVYTFIEHGGNVYILYAAAYEDKAAEITEAAYYGILQSLSIALK